MSARRVVVGMSGGVDSSVAAWLLKQQGYEVVGLFMKNWEDDDDDEYCSTRQDLIDAAAVADLIGIELEAVNFAAEYKDRVFAEFLREYAAGRTPNPDVLCNAEIKFKAFLDHAMKLGAEHIATGHYARVRQTDQRFELLRGLDPSKDQSYFLHRLNQAQLARTLFPIGHLRKTEVRRMATELGLPNAKKKDSTGICFIGERPFREFLNRYLPMQPGPIRDADGRVVGEHVGLAFYTLGQRKGIGLGGTRDGSGEPWFVARKDMASNTLWVVQGHDHPWLMSHRLAALDAAWVAGEPPTVGTRLAAKTRYR
ncbi:MAG TPA: tRNA 2-thiouridine(34) synthase MnmA, partial [Burkholderiaceae bacterium]|nr:tRNA 2-thiouridine(34) synthase MnmA [Burkholderiaceae bacterium]